MRLNGDDMQVEISISKFVELIHLDIDSISMLLNELSVWINISTEHNEISDKLGNGGKRLITALYNAIQEQEK